MKKARFCKFMTLMVMVTGFLGLCAMGMDDSDGGYEGRYYLPGPRSARERRIPRRDMEEWDASIREQAIHAVKERARKEPDSVFARAAWAVFTDSDASEEENDVVDENENREFIDLTGDDVPIFEPVVPQQPIAQLLPVIQPEPQSFYCEQCAAPLYSADSLRRHMVSHTTVWKFVCSRCDTRFHSEDQFLRHAETKHRGLVFNKAAVI
jgi:hypothetical protein